MWDKPHILFWLANGFYTVAALLALYAALYFVIRLPWFELKTVNVNGDLAHVTPEQLMTTARSLKGNFFTLDLDEARYRFEKLPWVRGVSLRRQWPDRLDVTLEEQIPLARWGGGGLVNMQGEVFAGDTAVPLPLFSGPAGTSQDIAKAYATFTQSLEPIRRRPTQVQMTARRAWQLRLDNGMILALGRARIEARLQNFAAVYERTVGAMQWQPDYVDLRYDNGFALRVPEAMRRAGAPAKLTRRKSA